MELKQRKRLRLEGYDYTQRGLYFVTICLHNRECLLGKIENGNMLLNPTGEMIERWYHELESKYDNVKCLEYVVMPNHFHCVIQITRQTNNSLSDIVGWFKTMTTNEYIRGVKNLGWKRFDTFFWQRSFIENIINNENSYWTIANYINDNPSNWKDDRFHPDN